MTGPGGVPAPPRPRRGRAPTTLATRITLACLAVAVLAATVAALTSARLVGLATRDEVRQALSAEVDSLAAAVERSPRSDPRDVAAELTGTEPGPLARLDVWLVVISPDGTADGPTPAVAAASRAGVGGDGGTAGSGDVSRWVRSGGRTMLVEARSTSVGTVALVQEYREGWRTGTRIARSVAVATIIGLVGAAVVGSLLAGLVSRPLRRVALVAHSLRDGRRDQEVPVEGPREVADVAVSVNELAHALRQSEARQRQFLMSVSHELRTPLTAVRGFAESIADGVVADEDLERAARTILAEAGRLDRLVSDLLSLARLGADDFRLEVGEVDVSDLVEHAAAVWRVRAEAVGVTLEQRVEPGLRVRTDAQRVRQVIDGLAENALRVTPAGRPLVIELRALTSSAPAGPSTDEPVVVLEVRDGGPGLAPEDYAVAFERGTLHEKYRGTRPVGTGIGLSLAHSLVERLGGRIAVEPAAEGGAAFRVELPQSAPHPAPHPAS